MKLSAGFTIQNSDCGMVKLLPGCKHQLSIEQVIPWQQTKERLNKVVVMCTDPIN